MGGVYLFSYIHLWSALRELNGVLVTQDEKILSRSSPETAVVENWSSATVPSPSGRGVCISLIAYGEVDHVMW